MESLLTAILLVLGSVYYQIEVTGNDGQMIYRSKVPPVVDRGQQCISFKDMDRANKRYVIYPGQSKFRIVTFIGLSKEELDKGK